MQTSDRLYNEDLKPAQTQTWGAYSITAVWFAAVHNIGVYAAAAGLFLIGIPVWQVLIGLSLGYGIAYFAAQLIGNAGQKYGVPFPVLARASFGVFGANIPALLRGAVAIAWYGIQTFLASQAVLVLLLIITPGAIGLTSGSFLGLSPLSWICFMSLWALQLLVVTHGIELIRWVQNWAGAIVSMVMVVMAIILTIQAGGRLDLSIGDTGLGGGASLTKVLQVAFATVTIYATLLLNLCDFTRFSKSRGAVRRGNFWGLPVNGLLFSLTVAFITVAGFALYGRLITDPTEILQESGNKLFVAIGAVLFVFATMGVNIVANLVSPAYDFANVFPKHITFSRGAIITCILAVLVMPWKLYSSPLAITYFLGTMGALLGPVFGILMVDYYLKRHARLAIDDLYTDSPAGRYYYTNGINPRAIISLLIAAAVAVPLAVVPAWHDYSWLSWLVGVAVAALSYGTLTPSGCDAGVRLASDVQPQASPQSVEDTATATATARPALPVIDTHANR